MHGCNRLIVVLGLVLMPAVLTTPAEATPLAHTWVASAAAGGSDSNTCDITAPCATFYGAYENTATGGEITCLNSGNFGESLTITKSITIDCTSAIGSTTASGGFEFDFIFVETTAGSVVVLKGLDFDALSEGTCQGGGGLINFNGAGVLHIQQSKINHAGDSCNGILFQATGPAQLDVSDFTDNGTTATAAGIYIKPNSGMTATVSIDRSHINNNYFGIVADGTNGGIIRGTVSDSVVSGNAHNGITVSTTSSNVVLLIDQTKVAGNNYGLVAAGTNAGMLVRNSSVIGNATGLDTGSGGVLYSYGNNSVNGNTTTDGAFTGTVGLK